MNLNKTEPDLAERFDKLSLDVHTMKGNLAANTQITQMLGQQMDAMKASQEAGRADTAELLDIFRTTKSGVKFIVWFGSFMKWSAAIVAAVAGAWLAIKNGGSQ